MIIIKEENDVIDLHLKERDPNNIETILICVSSYD